MTTAIIYKQFSFVSDTTYYDPMVSLISLAISEWIGKNSLMNIKNKLIFRSAFLVLVLILMFFGFANEGQAYPEFIGLGYTSCATCHFNGAGNGALNDYGRGLFAAEIAAKPFWNTKKSDEELSAESGFLGPVALPYWFRPAVKSRMLTVEKSPGSKEQYSKKFYQMQQDIDLHIPFNADQTYLFAMNLGTVTNEAAASPSKTINHKETPLYITREYYLRGQLSESFWLYLGYMDKVFGIRHADHTSVNRSMLGLGQNDQVHGMILHFASEKNEFFINPYLGNLQLEKEKQFSGASIHYEYEPAEKFRLGASYLRSQDAANKERNTFAFILKKGMDGGHSFLAELGYLNRLDLNKIATTDIYFWSQASIKMVRGIFFQSILEYYKADIAKINPENMRWGLGLLVFPLQRMEFRIAGVTGRVLDPDQIVKDVWSIQSQLHFSF